MRRMRHLKPREIQGCDIAFDFSRPETLYDATSGGSLVAADGEIARSEDVSGNTRHATEAILANRPLRKVKYANGMDVALFDGTNDRLSAGDVADIGASPINVVGVVAATAGLNVALMSKIASTENTGRWGLAAVNDASRKMFALSDGIGTPNSAAWAALDASASPTTLTCFALKNNRTSGASAAKNVLRKNGSVQATSTAYTENGASVNTAQNVWLGCTSIINGTAQWFMTGYIGQVAKYSVAINDALSRRIEHALMRKWRING